jgi:hypothetical protein
MSLPGVCAICRRPVFWGGRSWREGSGRGARHHCPSDRLECGAWMRYARERCARRPGHTTEHRTQYALDNQYRLHMGRERAA